MFAVVQIDPDAPFVLPRTEADEVAASLAMGEGSHHETGFEDEDMEMQAALQASLMHGGAYDYGGASSQAFGASSSLGAGASSVSSAPYPPPIQANAFDPFTQMAANTGVRTPTQHTRPGYSVLANQPRTAGNAPDDDDDDDDDEEYVDASEEYPPVVPHPSASASARALQTHSEPLDPVEASRRRGEVLMARMMRQQEAAMRETYQEEEARVRAGMQPRRTRQDEEDDELARAIRESMAEARERGDTVEESDEPEEMEYDVPRTARVGGSVGQSAEEHRVYDDDDAELQAALRASLESMPEGFQIPNTPPPPMRQPPVSAPQPSHAQTQSLSVPHAAPAPVPVAASTSSNAMDGEDMEGDTESEADSSVVEEAPVVDVDEMRRRRLAKFGGGG